MRGRQDIYDYAVILLRHQGCEGERLIGRAGFKPHPLKHHRQSDDFRDVQSQDPHPCRECGGKRKCFARGGCLSELRLRQTVHIHARVRCLRGGERDSGWHFPGSREQLPVHPCHSQSFGSCDIPAEAGYYRHFRGTWQSLGRGRDYRGYRHQQDIQHHAGIRGLRDRGCHGEQ